eukprot:1976443-Heterocapsa_arctica.AAC.1
MSSGLMSPLSISAPTAAHTSWAFSDASLQAAISSSHLLARAFPGSSPPLCSSSCSKEPLAACWTCGAGLAGWVWASGRSPLPSSAGDSSPSFHGPLMRRWSQASLAAAKLSPAFPPVTCMTGMADWRAAR